MEKEINNLYNDIKVLIEKSRNKVYKTVNIEMINLYWNIGKIIIQKQEGKTRAKYGDLLVDGISKKLTEQFGKGFSKRNLERMRKFYLYYPIATSIMSQLSWTHYLELIKIKEKTKRDFYMHECIESGWTVEELQRQRNTLLYERLAASKDKSKLLELKEQGAICLEGVINYIYNHCVDENNTQMLKFLLFGLIKERDNQIDAFHNRRNTHISSWGLTLLFETNSIDSDLGKKYVDYILKENPGKEGQKLLVYLLKQEYSKGKYSLDVLLNAFLRIGTLDEFKTVIDNTISSWEGEGVTARNLTKIHEKLIKVNKEGAYRFAIYIALITMCYDWNGNAETQEYIRETTKLELIDKYIGKLRECIH